VSTAPVVLLDAQELWMFVGVVHVRQAGVVAAGEQVASDNGL